MHCKWLSLVSHRLFSGIARTKIGRNPLYVQLNINMQLRIGTKPSTQSCTMVPVSHETVSRRRSEQQRILIGRRIGIIIHDTTIIQTVLIVHVFRRAVTTLAAAATTASGAADAVDAVVAACHSALARDKDHIWAIGG